MVFIFLLIICLIVKIIPQNKINSEQFNSSSIKLKVKGIGYKYVFCPYNENFNISYYPNEIYINGNLQNTINSKYYFNKSDNNVELIWYNNINNPSHLFYGCVDVTEIDLSYFNTSEAIDMVYMFRDCISLTSLNLSNFDTSHVTQMFDMFRNCSSLPSLDLSSFNTSKVGTMVSMFIDCISLTSLNLSNFDTSNVGHTAYMFAGCINLEYINFQNFTNKKLVWYEGFFNGVPKNIVICVSERYKSNIGSYLSNQKCYNIDCSNDWKSKQKKIDYKSDSCIQSFNDESLYEYNGKCYQNCQKSYLIDENKNIDNIGKCKLEKYFSCKIIALYKNFCMKCHYNYYQIENDPSNLGEYINCYREPKGYYLDKNASLYKKCYYTCKTCEKKGTSLNHNCLTCNENYPIQITFNNLTNYTNCYENCSYYYFDKEGNYHCISQDEYPKITENTNKYIEIDDKSSEIMNINYSTFDLDIPSFINDSNKFILNITEIQNKTNEIFNTNKYINITELIHNVIKSEGNKTYNEINYYDVILNEIENIFTSKHYDTSNIDKGINEIIETEKMTLTLTTTENLKNIILNNSNINMTVVDLEECEVLLRNHYNISDNERLYMKKMDVTQEKMKIPKIKYDVYCKLNGTNLIKLNLSICYNSQISLLVPVKITESIDKVNSSSKYYNDKCYSSKSDKGTDIILQDRKAEFIEGNKTVCQEYCKLSYYDSDNNKVNCSCQLKEIQSVTFSEMNIDRDKLYENFGDSSNKMDISNLDITSCNVLSSTENIKSNTGFYLLFFIFVIFIIVFILFYIKGINLLENTIDEVIYKKFKKDSKNKETKIKNHNENQLNIPYIKGNDTKNQKHKKHNMINIKNNSRKDFLPRKNQRINNLGTLSNIDKISNKKKIVSNKPDTDYELNWLEYKEALKFDKRTNCDYYGVLIKSKQLFIFTFCSFQDYNSGIIKKFIFFLSFALHYTVNALFFDDSNLHKIYEDEGEYNIGYQIKYIIYSAIISTVILRLMLQFLILTDKDISEIKSQETKNLALNMKKTKLKNMKIKILIFFVLNFILLGFFWYYLTCFNAIYKNTQVYLIINTFISFGFSLFYPFVINIIPTIIRMNSIHSSNKNQEYCYKISQLIQII